MSAPPIETRRRRVAERRESQQAAWRKLREGAATQQPLSPVHVSALPRRGAQPRSGSSSTNTPSCRSIARRPGPAAFSGRARPAGLGWGAGAALGVKLAEPDRQVTAVLGDGSYIFSNPVAVHHAAQMHKLPVLFIVVNNAMWGAVRRATLGMYPQGDAAKSNKPPFIDLDELPAFDKVCEAAGGYGERVEDPAELSGALERALKAVDGGQQALLNVICQGGGGGLSWPTTGAARPKSGLVGGGTPALLCSQRSKHLRQSPLFRIAFASGRPPIFAGTVNVLLKQGRGLSL